jgi:hypothetical protein
MKVYVDELPKSCVDCPCYDCEWGDCNLEDINLMSTNDFSRYEQRHQDCPLHSLAEHDKAKDHQIELLNKRWEMLKEYINGFKEYNIEEANMAWILTDKMQELEQEKL